MVVSSFNPIVIFLRFSAFLPLCLSLYEDQIGVFDWNQQFIGNIRVVEQRFLLSSRAYLFGSERNVIASVNADNGSIVWRHVLEDGGGLDNLFTCETTLISLSSVPNHILRAWDGFSGSVSWEKTSDWSNRLLCRCGPVSGTLMCYSGNNLMLSSLLSGKDLWTSTLPASVDYMSVNPEYNATHKVLSLVGVPSSGIGFVKSNLLLLADGSKPPTIANTVSLSQPENCQKDSCLILQSATLSSNQFLVCISSTSNGSNMDILSLGDATSEWITFPLHQDHVGLKLLNADTFAAVSAEYIAQIFQLDVTGQPKLLLTVPQAMYIAYSDFRHHALLFVGNHDPTKTPENFALIVYDLRTGDVSSHFPRIRHWNIPQHHGLVDSMYVSILPVANDSPGYRVLLKTQDHAILLFRETGQLLWVREEALADVSAVELVDLPVSESQARMEEEFGHTHKNILEMFIRRLRTQWTQFVALLENFVYKIRQVTDELLSHSEKTSMSTSPSSMTSLDTRSHTIIDYSIPPRLVSTYSVEQSTNTVTFLTRDTFNLHKMIVVATAVGKLFGLESSKGHIIWERSVPDAAPLTNGKLMLIQQRSTAHFPLPPVTTLVMRSKNTRLPVLISFNPITGAFVQQFHTHSSDHVYHFPLDAQQIIPFPGPVGEETDYLRPIILMDENSKVHTYPSDYNSSLHSGIPPLYLYTVEPDVGRLTGYRVGFDATASQEPTPSSRAWQMFLRSPLSNSSQKIVAVASRPLSEHIHSVGRVLGDRSVLYKYLNPNLIVVLTVGGVKDSQTDVLTLYLIDVVVGRVLYSSLHRRCGEPINLVVSENWIIYTYYNHKSLRHEATVLELFEPSLDGQPCAAHSVPSPVQLFLQNIIAPMGLFSHTSDASRSQHEQLAEVGLGHRVPQGGIRAIFSSLYRTTDVDGACISSGHSSLVPHVMQQSYIFTTPLIHAAAAVSLTERGITSKSLIFGLQKGALIELPKSFFDPRRTLDMTPQLAEEGIHPYAPVLPLSDQSVITFNHTVMGIRSIRTAMTGLESTSLVLACGLDMFFTRIAPSLTYDLLKEDFDYNAIATVTLGMIVASVVTKRLAERRAMFRAWT